ncbi:MAG: TonB-dependent receptor [Pseudomonadota bacterium]
MKTIEYGRLLGVLTATSIAAPLWAQNVEDLGVIVVIADQDENLTTADQYRAPDASSATGAPTPIEQIPQSITVIPRDVIDDQLATDVTDVIRNVAGVEGKTAKERTQQLDGDYLVRGQFTEAYVNGRSTFLDQGLDPESLVNVERIEVLKGPTAGLFDSANGAPPGGVINLVEKAPETTAFSTFGTSINSDGGIGLTFDLNRPVSADQTWLFRATGHFESGEDDLDLETQSFSLYPTLRYNNGRTDVIFRTRYQEAEFEFYNGLPIFGGAIAPGLALDDVLAADDQPTNTTVSYGISVDANHEIADGLTARASLGWQKADGDQFNSLYTFDGAVFSRADYSQFLDVELFDIGAGVLWETQPSAVWEHKLSVDAGYQRTTEQGNTNFSFAGFNADVGTLNMLPFVRAGGFGGTVDGKYRTTSLSILSQSSINERLFVLAGATVSDVEISYDPVPKFSDTVPSYRIGVAYEVFRGLSPFIGYSEGFRAPRGITDPRTGSVAVALETNSQAEIGLRFNIEEANLSGSLAAYRLDRDDASLFSDIGAEVIDLRSEGIELELIWQVTSNMAFLANYAFTDARVNDPASPNDGNRAQRVPEHSGRIAARYEFEGDRWDGLGIGLGFTYFSNRAADLANTFFAPSVGVFDLQASYVNGNMRASLGIENLLDTSEAAPNFYFSGNAGQIKPLTITANAEWTF